MAKKLRVALEIGPRGKKVAAWAPGWPGLERGAATPEKAIERLLDYLPRYQKVAKFARLNAEFATFSGVSVVEENSRRFVRTTAARSGHFIQKDRWLDRGRCDT